MKKFIFICRNVLSFFLYRCDKTTSSLFFQLAKILENLSELAINDNRTTPGQDERISLDECRLGELFTESTSSTLISDESSNRYLSFFNCLMFF